MGFLLIAITLIGAMATVGFATRRSRPLSVWRARVSFGAYLATAASTILYVSTGFYAQLTRGFRYYDPTLLQIYRYGALTALIGVLGGVLGAGRGRLALMGLSGGMVLLWVLAAVSE